MSTAALQKYTVRDVLEYRGNPRLHHTVDDTSLVGEALALMDEHDIVSVPVFSSASEAFVDIVSVYDIRDYLVGSKGLEEEAEFQRLSGRPSGRPTALEDTVAQVVRSRKHASQVISARAPLADLLRMFTAKGQHRILVSDVAADADEAAVPGARRRERGYSIDSVCSAASSQHQHQHGADGCAAVCGLTQYDVVRFLQHHNHELGRVLDTPVADVARPSAPLPRLTVRSTALDALRLLRDAHSSALPVVDADGRMVTEIAGASLRRLPGRSLGLLGRPVLAYMFGLDLPVEGPYVVRDGFTLSQVMAGLLWMNCRRAWLVDRDDRPVAVISLTDVLCRFL